MVREQSFWSKVELIPLHPCWVWTGGLNKPNGYGQVWVGKRHILAHRYSWTLHNGPIPDGLRVLHRCDNPQCVRPDHLFLGTQQDNVADRDAKGRCRALRGEEAHFAKLTEPQVRLIRTLEGVCTQAVLADVFGVSQVAISKILRRANWAHLE